MANQSIDYNEDVYQWNNTASTDEGDAEYLPNWTDLVLAGLFTMLIIVTIVSNITSVLSTFELYINTHILCI